MNKNRVSIVDLGDEVVEAKAELATDVLIRAYAYGAANDATMKLEHVEKAYALALETFSLTDAGFKKLVDEGVEDSAAGEISLQWPVSTQAVAVAAKILYAEHTGDLEWEELDLAHEWALEARGAALAPSV